MDDAFFEILAKRVRVAGAEYVSFDELQGWPAGDVARAIDGGVLREIEPAKGLICDECDRQCYVEIDRRTNPDTREAVGVYLCSDEEEPGGQFTVDLQRLRQWEIVKDKLIELGYVDEGKAETVARDGPKNIFRNRGDRWDVRFNGGKVAHVDDLKGMGYIARLLARADVPIPATELANPLIDGKLMEKAGLCGAENGSASGSEPEQLFGAETLQSCQKRLREIGGELDVARKNNDLADIERLGQEKQGVMDYLRTSTGISGQARGFTNDVEKARKAVANAINTAINRIKKMEPRLAQHLDKLIDRGTDCKYEPGCEMDWQLQ